MGLLCLSLNWKVTVPFSPAAGLLMLVTFTLSTFLVPVALPTSTLVAGLIVPLTETVKSLVPTSVNGKEVVYEPSPLSIHFNVSPWYLPILILLLFKSVKPLPKASLMVTVTSSVSPDCKE